MHNKIFLFFLLAMMVLGGTSWGQSKSKPPPTVTKSTIQHETVPLVKTVIVKRGTIEEVLQVIGRLETWDEVNVSSKIAERVTKVFFDEGDYVEKGEILFQLEDAEIKIQLKQTELLLNKAMLGLKLLEDKIAIMEKQAKAGVEVSQAALTKVKTGVRKQEKEQARLAVEQAGMTLDNSKINYERLKKLYESRAIAKPQYEAAKLQYELAQSRLKTTEEMMSLIESGARDEDKIAAESSVDAAKSNLEMAESTRQEKDIREQDIKILELTHTMTQIMLDDTKIRAPISGVIVRKSINAGEMAAPGVPVFSINNINPLKVKTEIPENEIAKIKIGLLADLRMDAYVDKTFSGKIIYINPVVNPRSRTCGIEIEAANPKSILKPGMCTRITIGIGKKEEALIIPYDALIFSKSKYHLFIVQNGTAVMKYVELGLSCDENVEITEGVAEGDEVIVVGKEYVSNGSPVKVME